jgi:hypothetical protein
VSNEDVGLEQMDENIYRVFFHNIKLASLTAPTCDFGERFGLNLAPSSSPQINRRSDPI